MSLQNLLRVSGAFHARLSATCTLIDVFTYPRLKVSQRKLTLRSVCAPQSTCLFASVASQQVDN